MRVVGGRTPFACHGLEEPDFASLVAAFASCDWVSKTQLDSGWWRPGGCGLCGFVLLSWALERLRRETLRSRAFALVRRRGGGDWCCCCGLADSRAGVEVWGKGHCCHTGNDGRAVV